MIYVHNGGALNKPIVFGQLTKRDGSFLVGKVKDDNFTWDKLKGKTVIGGRRGGVPAMTLQYVVEEICSIELASVRTEGKCHLRTDVEFNLTASTFDTTDADYCTLFEPAASELVSKGKGHIVASVGEKSGNVPYTAFSATKDFLKNNKEQAKKFLRAVMKGYTFLSTASAYDIAVAIAPSFVGSSAESLVNAIESYMSIDAWNNTPVMKEADFEKLQDIMQNAGELTTRAKFAEVVDNSIAEEILAEIA